MKSLETRFLSHPRPPHSEIFNSRRVFFAARTAFEAVSARREIIISHNFNALTLWWP